MTKKRLNFISLVLFIALVFSIIWFVNFWLKSREFSTEYQVSTRYFSNVRNSNNIKVALIGDSWVAEKKLDDFLALHLSKRGWNTEIISFGQKGARSKFIYQNLFKSNSQINSSYDVLFGDPINICVVIAGVNDSSSYIGADFYAYHVALIVKSLRKRGIFPFILEVPEFGIEEAESKNPIGYIRRRLMRIAYHSGKVDVINDYRLALETTLHEKFKKDEYVIIRFNNVSTDYKSTKNLFNSDLIHLSEEGRNLLALTIANAINNKLSQNNTAAYRSP
ncbi:MAG: SGNH/GDSL hydrolase family protein [Methylomonas sp.]|jgi:lysophospholipase L1-like esterase|uniref:SGNH/GDSL hydrolase family protein n=1 Tax=Methylomonas sp. TaxID=418 RepID=UPI0025E15B8A|nr:SGNH/GDSL hydrolase family protein [Methylomonas sp.]MCK9607043.1 SGNH/GDSL hydrolase family protein [Methylomonas sp.]